jgi:hypothetical protein
VSEQEAATDVDGALRRILEESGSPELIHVLTKMPGADFTTLMLEVMRRRTSDLSATDIRRRYATSRFVPPGPVDPQRIDAVARRVDAVLGRTFERITLAPLVPLVGTHAVLGGVDQNNVVSTLRGVETAADPTAGLALEAAQRRSRLRSRQAAPSAVRLAARQRVTRAQHYETPGVFSRTSSSYWLRALRPCRSLPRFGRDAGDGRVLYSRNPHLDSGSEPSGIGYAP